MNPAASSAAEPLVKVGDIPGRGRGLFASRDIKGGEIVLSDSPLLLYPAGAGGGGGGAVSSSPSFCSNCFRSLPSGPTHFSCPFCPSSSPSSASALFCSTFCLSAALSSSHSPSLCRAIPPLLDPPDLRAQAHFLIAAFSLSLTSPEKFHFLLSLEGGGEEAINVAAPQEEEKDAVLLHSLLGSVTGFSLKVTALLIGKDKRNAFGLMERVREEEDGGGRRVRAYGIYPNASFFNHDCLPNACRFEYLDREGEGNADIVVRAIHDIPEGREVCLSYFPTNWGFKERQERLMEDYGFRCVCDRCQVEKNWKDEEEEEDMELMEEDFGENAGDDDDDFPHSYFFVRYVCDKDNCGGTMAPLPPSPAEGTPSGLIECNACGQLRKEDDFGGDDDDDDDDGIMIDE